MTLLQPSGNGRSSDPVKESIAAIQSEERVEVNTVSKLCAYGSAEGGVMTSHHELITGEAWSHGRGCIPTMAVNKAY
jgi:hypothetical protein